jgi:hypothetical protein
VFREPRVQDLLVANGIDGGNHNIRSGDRLRLDLDGRDLGVPRDPFTGGNDNIVVEQ